MGTFSALRIRNYRYLWLGQTCHAAALWMEMIARPFLVLEVTGQSAAQVGGVVIARVLPQVLFGMFAGVLTDFFDRRKILLADKTAILGINVAFAVGLLFGRIELWHIYAYAALRGALMAFDQPARQSMIPNIVPADRVTNALALLSSTQSTMRILGGGLGAAIYGLLGAAGVFSAICVVYVGSVLSTYMLDLESNARTEKTTLRAIVSGTVEGFRYGLSNLAVRGVLLLTIVFFSFCMTFMQLFLPVFAGVEADIGTSGAGGFIALMGIGSLAASLGIAHWSPTQLGRLLPMLVALAGALYVLFALAFELPAGAAWVTAGIVTVAIGAVQTSFFSLSRSLMLQSAPAELHGRVLGLLAFDRAFMSVGVGIAGLLVAVYGVRVVQMGYGLAAMVCALGVALLAPAFREVSTALPEERADAPV